MSLSFRKTGARFAIRIGAWTGAAGTLFCGQIASAADVYYQPVVSVATNANSNIDLTSSQPTFAEGYLADASTLIGVATPRSEMTLLPRLTYQYYPTQKELDRLEAFLAGTGSYSWQRDRFTTDVFFDHRDDLNSQQPSADYNPVTPGIGNTNPGTGRIIIGSTRNFLIVDPTFTHQLTPRSNMGVAAEYQRMSYSQSDTSGHIDFNYYLGRVFYGWNLTPRMDASISAFGSQYVAGSIDSHSTSGGAILKTSYNWSPALHSSLSLQYQETSLKETSPRTLSDSSHPWGAEVSTVYVGTTSTYRADVGRTIGPSAAGGLFESDQIRGQYDRDFTRRLHFTGALRFFHDKTISGISGSARSYTNALLRLQYMLSARMFVAGSYSNRWEKYTGSPGADGNVVSLQFGYRGLPRQ
jgi:hypothetical protein